MVGHHAEYYSEVEKFEHQVTRVSEQILEEQEKLRGSTLNEFNQTILQLVSDYEMFSIDGQCDPTKLEFSLRQLEEWTDGLKQLHLELESIDNFLRYVLPNDQCLQTLSQFDQKSHGSLHAEVSVLKDVSILQQENEVLSLQQSIVEKSDENIAISEKVKESCLEVSQDIDQCWKLLEEIETYGKYNSSPEQDNSDPTFARYNQWKWNQLAEAELKHLTQHSKNLHDTKLKLEKVLEKRTEVESSPEMIESFAIYQMLNKLWKSKFIKALLPDVSNLEVYPQSGKIQFDVEAIEVLITTGNNAIQSISLFSYELPYDKIEALKQILMERVEKKRSLFDVLLIITQSIINSL